MGPPPALKPTLDPELIDALPIELFFGQLPARLDVQKSGDVEAALAIELGPEPVRRVFVTVRRGVAEIAYDEPIPGTPTPVATLRVSAATWKRLALGLDSPLAAIAGGRLSIDGSGLDVKAFLDRFNRSL